MLLVWGFSGCELLCLFALLVFGYCGCVGLWQVAGLLVLSLRLILLCCYDLLLLIVLIALILCCCLFGG